MAKEQSFASKVAKATARIADSCKVCESPVTHALYVKSVYSEQTNAWKFKEGHVRVCKCNQQEVYG